VLGTRCQERIGRIDGYGVNAAMILNVAAVFVAFERVLYVLPARLGVEENELVAFGAHDGAPVVEPLRGEYLVEVGRAQVVLVLPEEIGQTARELVRVYH
jgi:hypothetical protein